MCLLLLHYSILKKKKKKSPLLPFPTHQTMQACTYGQPGILPLVGVMGSSFNTLKLNSSGLGLMLFISIALATKNLTANLELKSWGRKAWVD